MKFHFLSTVSCLLAILVALSVFAFYLEVGLVSYSLLGCAFLLVALCALLYRSPKPVYQLSSKAGKIEIDKKLIESYVAKYCAHSFPKRKVKSILSIQENTVHIHLSLPHTPPEKQPHLLSTVQKELKQLLAETIGCTEDLSLSLSCDQESLS